MGSSLGVWLPSPLGELSARGRSRGFAVAAAPDARQRPAMGDSEVNVFDGATKVRHRDRSAYLAGDDDPLQRTATERLLDRLEDCRRSFVHAAVLGGAAAYVVPRLAGGRAGIEHVTVIDTSQDVLDRIRAIEARARRQHGNGGGEAWPAVEYVRMEGELLPVEPESFDVVISSLGLHWFNDLPAVIAQCRFALRPDGLMLAALMGGDTLHELRVACQLAQMERLGGVSQVVSPLAQVRDAGNLLTRAGLAMPTVDVDTFVLRYACVTELVHHLRAMGETNAGAQRMRALPRDVTLAAAAVYTAMFGGGGDGARAAEQQAARLGGSGGGGADPAAAAAAAEAATVATQAPVPGGGGIPATFQVMYLTGWSPHTSQQQPKERGSATVSFHDLADGLVGEGAAGGSTGEGGDEDNGGGCATGGGGDGASGGGRTGGGGDSRGSLVPGAS